MTAPLTAMHASIVFGEPITWESLSKGERAFRQVMPRVLPRTEPDIVDIVKQLVLARRGGSIELEHDLVFGGLRRLGPLR